MKHLDFYTPRMRVACFRSTVRFFLRVLIICAVFSSGVIAQHGKAQSKLPHERKIRIACVGNSITYGGGLSDKANEAYPAVLQKRLGNRYEVGNFGKNGATLLRKAPNAYVETETFKNALAFGPDIVIIDLGINDTGLNVWPFFKDDFTSDYIDLIARFRALDSKPEIWICTMTPYFNQSKRFKAALRDWYWEVQDNIHTVSASASTGLIDLHTPLYAMPHLFSDAVHPDKEGARIMAETIYGVISGDHGGLSPAEIFGSHMVLQRNKPIPVWGKANRDQSVSVSFAGETRRVKSDVNGNWKVIFPPRKEGGPFEMKMTADDRQIVFDDILVGEVWICSGQSNMTFKLSESSTAVDDLPLARHEQIRLFNMKTADPSIRDVWEPELLERINKLEYEGGVWQKCTPETAASFSAVAYYFGKKIQEQLNVPVGLIHNSKGGSPAEAWIDRRTLEFDPILADLLQDWKKNPLIGLWCRERAIFNTGKAANPLQRHPYEPAYLFEACMKPWIGFPLKGAIWYQGEANVHNVELHETLFASLLKSWRQHWGSDFPVYFTQLSSFQSPAWPRFRDSQRKLMDMTTRTGMAVTTDLGDSLDIHPKRKKVVGERLALWALAKEYGYEHEYSGPLFHHAYVEKSKVLIDFTHANGLTSSDGKALRSFELAGVDRIFRPAMATTEENLIVLKSKTVTAPKYVRYGWKAYSDGNLINEAGLPASTFSAELQRR